MIPNELSQAVLRLNSTAWRVTSTGFSRQPPQFALHLLYGRDGQIAVPGMPTAGATKGMVDKPGSRSVGLHDMVHCYSKGGTGKPSPALAGAGAPRCLQIPAGGRSPLLLGWCAFAVRACWRPFQKLALTIRQYRQGIVANFNERITQGAMETINGIIQLAKRCFRNFIYLRAIAYWNTAN